MITHLRGKLIEKTPMYFVVECEGVGYFLNISLNTFSQIQISEMESIMIYIHFIVREDAHVLYGFHSILEREIFKLLISVSGIGPNTARTMLSSLTTEEIQKALVSEDVTIIQSIKGIGMKTAQRVIIELKDKIIKTYDIEQAGGNANRSIREEAISALEALGFSKKQVNEEINKILKIFPKLDLEKLIKSALKSL